MNQMNWTDSSKSVVALFTYALPLALHRRFPIVWLVFETLQYSQTAMFIGASNIEGKYRAPLCSAHMLLGRDLEQSIPHIP